MRLLNSKNIFKFYECSFSELKNIGESWGYDRFINVIKIHTFFFDLENRSIILKIFTTHHEDSFNRSLFNDDLHFEDESVVYQFDSTVTLEQVIYLCVKQNDYSEFHGSLNELIEKHASIIEEDTSTTPVEINAYCDALNRLISGSNKDIE